MTLEVVQVLVYNRWLGRKELSYNRNYYCGTCRGITLSAGASVRHYTCRCPYAEQL